MSCFRCGSPFHSMEELCDKCKKIEKDELDIEK